MSKIEITKCDICGDEQRDDLTPPKYWADVHSGKVELNFRSVPSLQCDLSKQSLCKLCALDLYSIIVDGIEFIKSERISNDG